MVERAVLSPNRQASETIMVLVGVVILDEVHGKR